MGAGSVNYYEHHIGDYAEATAHLSFVEDAAYSRCIRKYYATERALPADIKDVQRLVGARSRDERQAVETVLQEFFTLEADGWHQKRCDADITRYREKQGKARASANARWSNANACRTHAERNATDECERNANASETHDGRNAHQTPDTSNQEKEEKTKTPRKRGAAARLVPVETLIAEGVSPQHASDWLTARARKSLPLTPTAWEQTKEEARKAGLTVPDAIKAAAGNGWAGFKASWVKLDSRTGAPVGVDQFAGAL
jgi:uncharacterized protein YdaU (DUF1376 family)